MSDGASIMCEALKIECQVVIGYKGSNEAVLAVVRGEMDAIYSSDTSANSYVKSGQTRAIVTLSREKSRFFPDLPSIFESVKLTPEQEWWFNLRATLDALGRILVTTPNLPPERLAFLQATVKKVLQDPVLIAEGEKTQRYIDYLDAEQTRLMTVNTVSALTPEQKARVKKVMTRND
jgi:tripartite-type tricarboxylate transporter receptor subunit TctC